MTTAVLTSAVMMVLALVHSRGFFLLDYRGDLHNAGQDILHGRTPYRDGFISALVDAKRHGLAVSPAFAVPVYLPPILLATTPLSLLPYQLAGVIFMLLSAAALGGGLWLLDVRDWRCYLLAFVSWPTLFGLYLGSLSPLLVLFAAAAWRWRASVRASALACAAGVIAKLFPWTIVAWLVISGRTRSLAISLTTIVSLTLLGWALIGFAGFTGYPRMLSQLSYLEDQWGVAPAAAILSLGLPIAIATAAALLLGFSLLAIAWRLRDQADGQRRAFCMCVIAALVASPLVWQHYLVLLLVPIALMSPTLSPAWFAPLLPDLAITPDIAHHPAGIIPYACLYGSVLWVVLVPRRRRDLESDPKLVKSKDSAPGRPARAATAAARP